MAEEKDWAVMMPEEKKKQLFLRQKELLNLYLEKGAITKEKSLKSLTEKMGVSSL